MPDHHVSTQILGLIIIIKNLIRILQNRIHRPNLPPRIRDIRPRRGAHKGRSKHNSKILRAHAVGRRVLDDAVQVQGDGAQGGVVGVREVVDDCVEGVAADYVVFVFWIGGVVSYGSEGL